MWHPADAVVVGYCLSHEGSNGQGFRPSLESDGRAILVSFFVCELCAYILTFRWHDSMCHVMADDRAKLEEFVEVATNHYHDLTEHRYKRDQKAFENHLLDIRYMSSMEDQASLNILVKSIGIAQKELRRRSTALGSPFPTQRPSQTLRTSDPLARQSALGGEHPVKHPPSKKALSDSLPDRCDGCFV